MDKFASSNGAQSSEVESVKNTNASRRAGIKTHRNYTVDEVARLLKISPITVRRWLKSGLPALTDRKPLLILGEDLIEFLSARKQPKSKCELHECYCVKCRLPRAPAERMAEYVPMTSTTGNLRGLCPSCGTLMNKRVALKAISTIRQILDLTIVEVKPRIIERNNPSLNDQLHRKGKTHA